MNINELDDLLATLSPGCDDATYDIVKAKLVLAISPLASSSRNTSDTDRSRSDQQKVDIFESPLFNDPRNW